ncbi:MAG: XRE family transcriptional regulator [Pseudomonadota bacterium]
MEEKKQQRDHNADYFKDLTGDIVASQPREMDEIGIRIKNIREEKGLSLDELSKLTGFDVELLSNMEENKIQPQLGTVIKLSKALDSAFGRIVSGVGDKLYSVTRKNERTKISRSTSHKGEKQVYTYMSLAPEVKGRHMESLIVQLEENPEDEMSVHDGEEFIYVLEGLVALKIGTDSFILEPGDSVYYLSTTPHLIAAKKGNATILAVLYGG